MWLFPYETLIITTQLNADEVGKVIKSSIYIPDGYKFEGYESFTTKYFTGYINGSFFQLNQNVVHTRNPLPDIKGEIVSTPEKTQIQIKILSLPLTFILIFFMGVLLIFGVIMLLESEKLYYVPFIIMVIFYLIILLPFKAASNQIKSIFINLLDGEIKN